MNNYLQMETTADNFSAISPPVYDGKEPLYMFRRRFDEYMAYLRKGTHTDILTFINLLLNKDYTCLVDIKKIPQSKLPVPKHVREVIENNRELVERLNINTKRIDGHTDISRMINTILNKIGFSFMKFNSENNVYYSVKTTIIHSSSTSPSSVASTY